MRALASIALILMGSAGLLSISAYGQITRRSSVLAGGSADASGGSYTARGTLGQPITGLITASTYANGAGFWHQVAGSLPSIRTRYVAQSGNNTGNDCTDPASPCATITHAVSRANAGDTIELAAGTYNEPGLVINKKLLIRGEGVLVW